MHEDSIVVAQPQNPDRLILLFHGVGSSAENLLPIGEAISRAHRNAMVVSVNAPQPSTLGSGREWFSVVGITEQNRPERIAAAMPVFHDAVARWQRSSGVGAPATALVGFSQGAILSLEATQVPASSAAAGCVVSLAGRFAGPVRHAPPGLRFHFIHGNQDSVVPTSFSVEAASTLKNLGAEVTLDVLPGLGHGIDARALQLAIRYLGEQGTS